MHMHHVFKHAHACVQTCHACVHMRVHVMLDAGLLNCSQGCMTTLNGLRSCQAQVWLSALKCWRLASCSATMLWVGGLAHACAGTRPLSPCSAYAT